MYGINALGVPLAAEGVPVSGVHYFRASNVISGGEAGLRAGPGGVSIGRFGWASADGIVRNSRLTPTDQSGLVVIQVGDWRAVFWDEVSQTWKIREGSPVTLLAGGPGIWIQMRGGASWNARIYADPVDGQPVAGYGEDLEPTRWAVGTPVGPGGLSFLTTWSTPHG